MTYYLNGSSAGTGLGYTGELVQDTTEALAAIRDAMIKTEAGSWTVKTDEIVASSLLVMDSAGGANNRVRIYFQGLDNTVSQMADRIIWISVARLEGEDTEDSVGQSPTNTHAIQIATGFNNRLYLSVDEDSIVICTLVPQGVSNAVHAGYLDRLNTNDSKAIMIGYVGSYSVYADSESISSGYWSYARALTYELEFNKSLNWYPLLTCFSTASPSDLETRKGRLNPSTGELHGSFNSTNDAMCSGVTLLNGVNDSSTYWGWTGTSPYNMQRGNYYGSKNRYSPRPLLLPYYYLEGTDIGTGYSTTNFPGTEDARVDLWCKGYVKNCVTGMGLSLEGEQWESPNGGIYLSTGGKGKQGMRIA